MRVVFLHGLESDTDAHGQPTGTKATFLREQFGAVTPALDTSVAREAAGTAQVATGTWRHPFDGYEAAFATPMARALAACDPPADVLVGSSFGGAVALRLLHEHPGCARAAILLAGAGPKLTPYRTLPPDVDVLLVHGRRDDVVPCTDSEALAATSPRARLEVVDDDHRLAAVVSDDHLGRWVRDRAAASS